MWIIVFGSEKKIVVHPKKIPFVAQLEFGHAQQAHVLHTIQLKLIPFYYCNTIVNTEDHRITQHSRNSEFFI